MIKYNIVSHFNYLKIIGTNRKTLGDCTVPETGFVGEKKMHLTGCKVKK